MQNVVACLRAALPDSAWQVQVFELFLPSALGSSRPGRPAAKNLMRGRFVNIFRCAGHAAPEKTLKELEIVPSC